MGGQAPSGRQRGDCFEKQGDGMIGFVSRFVGLWLIAGALVAFVIDATKTIAASALTVTPLGEAWSTLSLTSVMSVQTFVQQQIEPTNGRWLWDTVIQWILLSPTWAVLGLLGFLLTYLGRRRRIKMAYA
jgi:hypothetical protein